MKKASVYRIVIVTTLAALVLLLVLQAYWFARTYTTQEQQFDHTVNLALRGVADELLRQRGDVWTRIPPIRQTASNSFFVPFNAPVDYLQLNSLLIKEFVARDIPGPFELVLVDHQQQTVVLGNLFRPRFLSPDNAACIHREPVSVAVDFSVTFPDKPADIVGAMSAWVFTAATCIAILIVFAFLLIDLSRQKKLAEVKADFINNMTHELQTPVANIAIASEVLRKAGASADMSKVIQYAGIIHQENQRLRLHIEQVLQTARLNRGEIAMNKRPVDLNTLIDDVTRTFEVRLQQRAGRLHKQLKAGNPWVHADPDHIAHVLFNLLDNADKYSHRPPEITISTCDHERGVLVSIADCGVGIRQEEQKFIFDQFYRAPTGDRHDVKGFGLGLAYVRHIMMAHAGTVHVTSAENAGSRFDLFFQTA